ncbi:phosphoribosyltransferase domain-containing protein [Metalysinibacillus jejuensis]|uniref:phosphoribosyltransferase domain-containing protein n=1 Tax=Metalysinibacillus jejuensis TaxID=914327 RepID=UPI000D399178|nr:phosphoribosyltransferase domain-containing protein [Metalysinibacillus jejuensis]
MEKHTKTSIHRYEDLAVTITTAPHNYGELYQLALRINKKRSFLFVSTVLGKHLPLRPQLPLIASALLAVILFEETTGEAHPAKEVLAQAIHTKKEEDIQRAYATAASLQVDIGEALVIGFAETATALGHGVYDCLVGTHYVHSTREQVDQPITLYFEEEHSHATDQRCYADAALFTGDTIILVDDEITTGQTVINIITSLRERFSHKRYIILSLLDWRTPAHCERASKFAEAQGIELFFYSLVKGTVQTTGSLELPYQASAEGDNDAYTLINVPATAKHKGYLQHSGRFGTNQSLVTYCKEVAAILTPLRTGRSAVIGTGEFMYVPMKIASYMGEDVWYHATTRSPIYVYDAPHYPIVKRFTIAGEIEHYIYNVESYDDIFIIVEKQLTTAELTALVKPFSAQHVYVVTM